MLLPGCAIESSPRGRDGAIFDLFATNIGRDSADDCQSGVNVLARKPTWLTDVQRPAPNQRRSPRRWAEMKEPRLHGQQPRLTTQNRWDLVLILLLKR